MTSFALVTVGVRYRVYLLYYNPRSLVVLYSSIELLGRGLCLERLSMESLSNVTAPRPCRDIGIFLFLRVSRFNFRVISLFGFSPESSPEGTVLQQYASANARGIKNRSRVNK